MRKTVAILGVPIDDLDTVQVLERLDEFVQSHRFHQVATANTDFLIKAMGDPELKTILRMADLVVPDGMPLVMASRWLRVGLRERVTGADLVPILAQRAAEKGYTLFMLGAKPDVALEAKARMEATNPGLKIVGCVSPPVASIVQMDNEAILAQIEAAHPDILLVAFGNPKQEKWIYMHRERLQAPVCIGIGATFDFLSGLYPRAPMWMQRSGLEWLHRLSREPRRLAKRYGIDLLHFARFISLQLWLMQRGDVGPEPRLTDTRVEDCTIISIVGSLGVRLLSAFQHLADCGLDAGTHLILDLQATTRIDSAAMGTLLNLPKRAAHVNREVRLVSPNRRIRRVLRTARAEDMFKIYPTVTDALRGDNKEELSINIQWNETRAIVSLHGRAGLENVANVTAGLQQIPDSIRNVDVDMRGVSYIDCAALWMLHRFTDTKQQIQGRVRLAASDAVKQALDREKLNHLFTLIDANALDP